MADNQGSKRNDKGSIRRGDQRQPQGQQQYQQRNDRANGGSHVPRHEGANRGQNQHQRQQSPWDQRRPQQGGRDQGTFQRGRGDQQQGGSGQGRPQQGGRDQGTFERGQRGQQQGARGQGRFQQNGRDQGTFQRGQGGQQQEAWNRGRSREGIRERDTQYDRRDDRRGPQQGQTRRNWDERNPVNEMAVSRQSGDGKKKDPFQMVESNKPRPTGPPENPAPVQSHSVAGIKRGTLGKNQVIEINYVRLDTSKMPRTVYHYDVIITPDRPKKFMRTALDQFQREFCPDIQLAYDGNKSLFTAKKLPKAPMAETVIIDDNGRSKEYKVEIKEVVNFEVDLRELLNYKETNLQNKPMLGLQVTEVVLAAKNYYHGVRAGRSFFCKPREFYDLKDTYEMYTGIFQSIVLGDEIMFNVDIAHKSVPQGVPVLQVLYDRKIDPKYTIKDQRDHNSVSSFLKKLRVNYEPPACFGSMPREYVVLSIGQSARTTKFTDAEGKEMTVLDYYASRGYKIKYPELNCLQVGSSKPISLPMELCSVVPHQILNRKDNPTQVAQMIKYTATPTHVRKSKIMDIMDHFDHNSSPFLHAFGLKIGHNFIKTYMRVLPAPRIDFGVTKTDISKGSWRLKDVFLQTGRLKNSANIRVAFIYDKCTRVSVHELYTASSELLKAAKRFKIPVDDTVYQFPITTVEQTLYQMKQEKYDYVFVILAVTAPGTVVYSHVKHLAEIRYGMLTQCVKDRTMQRLARDNSVAYNILIKFNAKFNGISHKLIETEPYLNTLLKDIKNVMFVGADVTHPSPDQSQLPSIVGIAASHDEYGASYNMQYCCQTGTQENIENIDTLIEHHLQFYKKQRKTFPRLLFYYRDGVSDGQLAQIHGEVHAIRRVCKKMAIDIKITAIVVIKRHHTRFFPIGKLDERFNNVFPGSIVDQYIVHPKEKEFFLVSHQAIQGTARPTRYNVLVDDSNMDIDAIQKLTYNLCCLFPRCSRSVSCPAPAYLAHLVAFRARLYFDGFCAKDSSDLKAELKKRMVRDNLLVNHPMFFI